MTALLVRLAPLGVSLCGDAWGITAARERGQVERWPGVRWCRVVRVAWRRR